MDKSILTPEESFDLIQRHIYSFKKNYKENSNFFLLWGWIMTIASLSHFILTKILIINEAYELMLIASIGNWVLFVLLGFLIEYFMSRNNNKKVFSQLDRFSNVLWKVTGASIPVTIILCIQLQVPPPPFFLLIMGSATTITGVLIKFKAVIAGGIAFFLFSIATTFVQNENTLLIMGAAIICCYLIPGYILKSAKE
jgi:hypothetical protein